MFGFCGEWIWGLMTDSMEADKLSLFNGHC